MSPQGAPKRMARILAMLPWIAAQDGVSVQQVCDRFGITRDDLLADLDVVWFVGVHPFTPAEMIDVVIEDERVWVHYADWFARPLRLTPDQGLVLVASGASLLSVPGVDPAGPLARGLDKVAAALGLDTSRPVEVDLGPVDSDLFADLERAVRNRRAVRLRYYAYGRDERTERVVEPHRLYAHDGHWYLAGHCRRADGDRVFRLDRIDAAEVGDDTFAAPGDHDTDVGLDWGSGAERVVLALEPAARWVVEQYPCDEVVEEDDGTLRVALFATARPWLERLLLQLGPTARVVEGVDEDVRRHAADRVLTRYLTAP